MHRPTATLFCHKLRETIAGHPVREAPDLGGESEADESYFGNGRKGKRGRGAAGKVDVVMTADTRSDALV